MLIGVFTTLKQQLETTKIEEVKRFRICGCLDYPEIPLSQSNPSIIRQLILAGIFRIWL